MPKVTTKELLTPFAYSLNEWFDHWDYFSEQSPNREAILKYFQKQYGDARSPDGASEACWKLNRFVGAINVFMRHREAPAWQPFIVVGEKTGLISHPLVMALAGVFTALPDDLCVIMYDPRNEEMLLATVADLALRFKTNPSDPALVGVLEASHD